MSIILIFALLSLTIWLFLIFAWGNFWKADQYLKLDFNPLDNYPAVCAIVPARNEADVI